MSLWSDLKVIYHMVLKPIRGKDHAQRLESFYMGQAEHYDSFRRRLLRGREDLWRVLGAPEGAIWVDMGGGTGANLEFFGDDIEKLQKVYLVDLSASLLKVAEERVRKHGWNNVVVVEADATKFVPDWQPVDVVTFSYSLTMIPDWFAAIDHAEKLLRPGGLVGVVDFYVARKYPPAGFTRHSWVTRWFWPFWFARDNVFLSPDHVPYLHRRFDRVFFAECRTKIPWVPFGRVPYYIFVGEKRA